MIPLKLQLKNFISYGSCQIIDFSSHQLICLTGKNGHGKSALLDAITWSLWGQARKISGTSKPDEKLLRLGQSHMFVSLDFITNAQTYRVRREFTCQQGKSSSYLDFGIIQENGSFKALTDKTMRATQEKIDHAIGLSYESFINSVFLRQGQSNEFSKKTPQERKEVLASILGLQRYEELRKKAQEKAKLLQAEKERISFNLKAAQTTLIELSTSSQELFATESELYSQQAALEQKRAVLETLQKEIQQLEQENTKAQLNQENLAQIKAEINQLQPFLTEKIAAWRLLNKQMLTLNESSASTIQQELALHEQQLKKNQELSQSMQETKHQTMMLEAEIKQNLEKKSLEYQHTITAKKIDLQRAQQSLAEVTKQKEAAFKDLQNLIQMCLQLNDSTLKLDTKLVDLEPLKLRFEKRKAFFHTYTNQINSIKATLHDLEVQTKHISDSSNQHCPLCEQSMHDETAKKVHETLIQKINTLSRKYARLATLVPHLKKETAQDYASIQELTKLQEQRISVTERLQENNLKQATIKNSLKALELQQAEISTTYSLILNDYNQLATHTISTLEEALKSDAGYKQLTTQLTTLTQELIECGYDSHAHDSCKIKFQTLVLAQNSASPEALKTLQQERRVQIRETITKLKTLKKHMIVAHLQQSAQSIEQQLAAKKFYAHEVQTLLQSLQHLQESLMHKRGTLEVRTTLLKNAQLQEHDCLQQLAELDKEQQDYVLLQQAFSKDGIQALLIEHALPELEEEANNLLSKLTDNQASLKIESIRDLKTGGTKETLDITIADAAGTRAYELFSGGEAFRIDFALRVALSKLLARRAGTTLQTLIIDEGFGSQDEEGLAHIMEVLHRIQDEFAKIIIVSHLPSMKEQFPVNFYINKGADGSTIQVLQQG